MANMSNLGFNAEEVEPNDDFQPLPAGEYKVMVTDSEMKENSKGTGSYLQLRLDVIEGEYENRVVFDRLNLQNTNQTAVEIAQRQLSALCRAVGVMQPQDSSDLHDKPLIAKIGIQPARDGYEASNNVKTYKSCDGAAPASSGASSKPAASGDNNSRPLKPWESK